jgi:hypothetical protein
MELYLLFALLIAIIVYSVAYLRLDVNPREDFSQLPISPFTYAYMTDNLSTSSKNKYFKNIYVMDGVKQPDLVQGTLLDKPKTYRTYNS